MDAIQKQKLTSLVKETIVGMEQRQAATSFLRDVMDQAKQDGFKPKQIKTLAKLAMDRSKEEVQAEVEEIFQMYEELELNN